MTKPRVGFYAITGCQGCLLSVIFNEDELLDIINLIDIRAFPFIKEKKDESKFDIVVLEGTVVSNDDLNILRSLREKTKILVALGACSCNGGIPSFKNFIPSEKYKHLVYHKAIHIQDLEPLPIDHYVKVDYYLPGCPPDKEEILDFLKTVMLGKTYRSWNEPVCYECKVKNNRCLLEDNKLCLGSITRGNCKAICTSNGLECWGCRGPTDDANVDEIIALLSEKGFKLKEIRQRLESFVGLKFKEREEKEKKRWLH